MKEVVGLRTSARILAHRLNSLAGKRGIYNALDPIFDRVTELGQFTDFSIDDAERNLEENQAINDLLLRLRDWLFDVSDLIDEVELEVQSRPQQPGGISLSRLLPFSEESRLVSAANKIHERLDLIVRDMSKFQPWLGAKPPNLPRRTKSLESSFIDPLEVIGRESDNMEIQNAILDHVAAADSGVLVIGILGIKGIGKSTLAKLIYNDESIRSRFDSRLWVADAEESCYAILHQLTMLAMQERLEDKSLGQLEKKLRELLDMKRVFLVLNNVLPECSLPPEQVYGLLRNAAHGSVVILTTCSRQVALAFRASMIHELRLLSHDDAYQLFTRFVGRNGQIRPEFQEFARKFVQLSHGHPLPLRMIAGLLRYRDSLPEWEGFLERTGVKDCMETVFNCISDGVPLHLKLPFCTLGMQQVFSVEEFVCVWMALGFVHSDDPNEQPECIGRKYLRELYDYVLLVDVEYAPGGVLTDFRLHDLVNDVSTNLSFEQGFRILRQGDVSMDVDNTIKYLVLGGDCLADTNLLAKLPYMDKLQLFVLCPGKQTSGKSLMKIPFRQLSNNKRLRVLGLGGCSIEILPNFIGQLKHLRYLDVGRNELLSTLPDSMCNLWHLQTLLLHGCHQLKKLPAGIGKLQNLRYLTLTTLQETLQEELGQLTSLRTLALSSCQCLISLPCSLKNLKKLQTLAIVDCPKVDLLASSSVEALEGMDDICSLLLSGVPQFQHLPPIVGTPSVAMKHLLIQFSTKLSGIAWLNHFLYLRSLTIEDCPELSTLEVDGNSQFTYMTELVIRKCPQLGDTKWVRQFVSLRSFIIDDCPELAALDAGFTELKKLERLEIRSCPILIGSIEMDSSYISHVHVVELDGVPLNRSSESKNSVQQGCSTTIASSSNQASTSEISEDTS